MLNCFKKTFLVFLFLYVSLANAMIEKTEQDNLDEELWNALRTANSDQDFKQIEEYLNKGANLNAKSGGQTPLTWAACNKNTNLLKFFIQRGADVNLNSSGGWTPLGYSILAQQRPNIEILCNSGASLVNLSNRAYPGANAFHCAVKMGGSERKEIIKILITHARFDFYNRDQGLERKILAALSVLSGLSFEIRLFILEKLTLVDDDYCSSKKLCKQLLSKGYNSPIFIQVRERVKKLKEILGSVDSRHDQTPLDWAFVAQGLYGEKNKEICSLLDKYNLQKNWDNFNAGFPGILESEPDNPVCLMYNNCTKLFEDKNK